MYRVGQGHRVAAVELVGDGARSLLNVDGQTVALLHAKTPRRRLTDDVDLTTEEEKVNVTRLYSGLHTDVRVGIRTYVLAYILNNNTIVHQKCIHAYMHTCIHAYMHTCMHAYMHTCIHAYMQSYIQSPNIQSCT